MNVPNAVDSTLDEFVADVFNYVNSAGDSFPPEPEVAPHLRGVYGDILGRFYGQLTRARNDGCERLQVVAHSLGTVVSYHALRGLRFDEASRCEVANHRLLGGGFLSGHIAYERSASFLEALARGLLGDPMKLRRTARQRFKDRVLLLGETLLAPVGLLVVLIAGAFLWVLLVTMTSFLLSLPFRPLVEPQTLGPIFDSISVFLGAMMLITFLILPPINAGGAIGKERLRADRPESSG